MVVYLSVVQHSKKGNSVLLFTYVCWYDIQAGTS